MRLACKRKESQVKSIAVFFRGIFRWVMFPARRVGLVGSPAMGSIVPHGGGLMSLDDCNDCAGLPVTSLENSFVTIAAANTGR